MSVKLTSALPPKADMCGATAYVRFVPEADMRRPLTERTSPARSRRAPLVQLVSYANGISALVLEMFVLS